MNIRILIALLLLPFLASAQTMKLTSNGKQLAIAIDDIILVRASNDGGAIITYGTINQKVTVTETITQVRTASCSKLVSMSVYENISGVETANTLLFNVLLVSEIRPTSDSKAIITLGTTPKTTYRSTGSYTSVANTFSACISGGGSGGITAVVHDSTLTGNGTALSPLSVVDAGGSQDSIPNSALMPMPALTIKGNNTGATGPVLDLTVPQVQAMLSIDDLGAMTGLALGNTNLLTFTGSIIPNNTTIKIALQSLETAIESIGAMATFQDDGVSLPHRGLWNFIGPSITLTDNGGANTTEFTFDSDLNALAALASNGIIVKTGTGTMSARTIVSGADGIAVTNGNGVAGNPSVSPADDLAAIEALNANGLIARIGTDNWINRIIVGPAAGISISNGNAISGNPTLALANDLAAIEALNTTGWPVRTGTDTYVMVPFDVTAANPDEVLSWNGASWAPRVLPVQAYVYNDGDGIPPPITPDSEYGPFFGWNEGAVEWWEWDGIEWILAGSSTGSFFTSDEFTGDGSGGAPLTLAQQGASSGQVLKWDGSAWTPAQVIPNGDKGDIDVTSLGNTWAIDTSAVTTIKIQDAAVTMAKIAQAGATSGQVIAWNGSAWAPAAGGGGSSITDFTGASGAAPAVSAASHGGETYRNDVTGELWGSDGSIWYPFIFGHRECLDTVLVSLITVEPGGIVSTGSPLIRNSSGIWEHFYDNATSATIPDGVVVDIVSGPRALIGFCGVMPGSGGTPNASYYVDETANTGFTTTLPAANIRPLGKVAANGDFLINAGLTFSNYSFLGVIKNGSLSGKGVVGDTLRIATGDRGDVDVANNGLTWTVDTNAITSVKILDAAVTMAKIAQAGATTNQVIRWNGSAWVPGPDAGTGGDSTFAKINGAYTGKNINDNVYRNGTTGFRTTDTTGVLNIQPNDLNKPVIYFSGNLETIFRQKVDSRAASDSLSSFGLTNIWVDNSSDVGDNQVFTLGYNTAPGGGKIEPTKASVSLRIEEKYDVTIDANKRPSFEVHLPHIEFKNSSDAARPLTGLFGHERRFGGGWTFENDYIYFEDFTTNTPKVNWGFGTNSGVSKGIGFLDTAIIGFGINNTHILSQKNAAGSGFIKILKVDNLNRILFGGEGESAIAAFQRLVITNNGYLDAEAATGAITIGSPTAPTRLDINAPDPTIQKWSVNNVERAQHFMNSNRWDVYGSVTGTYPLKFWLSAPENSISLNANGKLCLGDETATSRLDIVSSNGATERMQMWKNSTGESIIHRSNASPETIIYGVPGDLAIVGNGTNGSLYGKYSGTGYTGWGKYLNLADPNGASSGNVLGWDGSAWAPTPGATGTVTSVGLSLPSIFTVSGSPVSTSGTLTGTLATQSANTVFAGPTSGGAATPAFRALVAADITTAGGVTGTGVVNQIAFFSPNTTTITTESGSGASSLFWDSGNDRLGVGNAAPTTTLDVTGEIKASSSGVYPGVFTTSSSTGRVSINAASNSGFSFLNSGAEKWIAASYLPSGTNYSFTFYNLQTTSPSLFINGDNNFVGLGNDSPQRKLHVSGEVRVDDLTTDTPTRFVGADSDGDFGQITFGSQFAISGTDLNLAQNGASSGQVIKWNGSAWAPGTDISLANTDQTLTGDRVIDLSTHGLTISSATVTDLNSTSVFDHDLISFTTRDLSGTGPRVGEIFAIPSFVSLGVDDSDSGLTSYINFQMSGSTWKWGDANIDIDATNGISITNTETSDGMKYVANNETAILATDRNIPDMNTVRRNNRERFTDVTSTTSPVNLTSTNKDNLINQGGTQATFTFSLPATPGDGQICELTFSNAVTTLTITAQGGITILGTAPTTAAIGDRLEYKYYAVITSWVRLQQ